MSKRRHVPLICAACATLFAVPVGRGSDPPPVDAAAVRSVGDGARSFGPFDYELQIVTSFAAGVHGMAFAPDGTLYFSDSFANHGPEPKVYSIAPPYTAEPLATGIAGTTVSGLKWEGDDLYVCVTGEGSVRRYNADLQLQQTWSVSAPWNVERIGAALLAVTNSGQVRSLKANGSTTTILSGLAFPFDIAPAGADTFWVSEQVGASLPGRVRRFDLNGNEIEAVNYTWNNPEGLAVDDRGWLYVADTGAGAVVRVSPTGDVEVLSDAFALPVVMTRHPDGDIFFTTSGALARLVRIVLTSNAIPATSAYGVALMACLMLIGGALIFTRYRTGHRRADRTP